MIKKLLSLSLLALIFLLSACGASSQASTAPVASKATPTIAPSPTPTPSPTPIPSPTPKPAPVVSEPVRLMIPVIGVNAPVEKVGILDSGNLATPVQNPWDGVGWFQIGPKPGQMGSAVIDGHVDRPGGGPAIFWDLRKLHPGDDVMVADAQGKTIHFRVMRVAYYSPKEAPLQEIFNNGAGTYLNLITCAGVWIPAEQQTSLRLVVYTSLVQ